jgi:hypothetical protein
MLYKLKVEKGDDGYDIRAQWPIEAITNVDAIDKRGLGFSLEFERVMRWQAEDAEEKNAFLRLLRKLCHKFIHVPSKRPAFNNMEVRTPRMFDHL